jgi:hypothetical protein
LKRREQGNPWQNEVMAKQYARFIGHWSIVSSPDFDDDYLHMEVKPYLELHESEGRLMGEYHVGLQQGGIDGRMQSDGSLILAFEGNDEMDAVNGAGTLKFDADGRLVFTLMYAHGDDFAFMCEKTSAARRKKTSRTIK